MKKQQISQLSPEEALDEATVFALDRKLQAARNAQVQADKRLKAVFVELESLCIDPSEITTSAESAATLEEAITRYARNGEFSRSGIMRELRAAYGSRND